MRQCCTGYDGKQKQKYKTQEEAENAAERRNDEGVKVSPYPCEDGDGWHLTSKEAPPLVRPIKVMTKDERKLYKKHIRNRMGSLLNEELVAQLKTEARSNTLPILKKRIDLFQNEFNNTLKEYDCTMKQYRLAKNSKEEIAGYREKLLLLKGKAMAAKKKLSAANREYESAKRRITYKENPPDLRR